VIALHIAGAGRDSETRRREAVPPITGSGYGCSATHWRARQRAVILVDVECMEVEPWSGSGHRCRVDREASAPSDSLGSQCAVVGVMSRSEPVPNASARQFNIPQVYQSLDEN